MIDAIRRLQGEFRRIFLARPYPGYGLRRSVLDAPAAFAKLILPHQGGFASADSTAQA
jgi:hypothetical protein